MFCLKIYSEKCKINMRQYTIVTYKRLPNMKYGR